jgi:dolichol-phosphate mannosyltransferase
MKKKLAISVVTPIYNDVLTMEQVLLSLVSILSKRKVPYEIVCIDDCSTDGSLTVARRLANTIPALRIFSHSTNKGIAHTYRELYARARGDRVVLFSLDGEWDPRDVGRLLDKKEDIRLGAEHISNTRSERFVSYMYNVLMRGI